MSLSFGDQHLGLLDHKINVVVRSCRSGALVVVLSSSDSGNLRLATRLVLAGCNSTAFIGGRATTPVVIHLSIKLFGCLSWASLHHRSSVILFFGPRTTSVTTLTTTFTTIGVLATSTRTASSLTRGATITATTTTRGTARAAGASAARRKVAIDVARIGTSTATVVDAVEQAALRLFYIVERIARGASFLDGEVDGLAHCILSVELAEGAVGEVRAGVDDVGDALGAVVAVVEQA